MRLRFALFGAAVAVLTAGVLGGWLVWMAFQGLRDQAQQDQLALARTLASRVDQGLSQAYQAVAALAERGDAAGLQAPSLGRDLALVTRRFELLDQWVLVDRAGRVLAHSQPWWPETLPPAERYFSDRPAPLGAAAAPQLSDVYRTPDGELAVFIRAPVRRGGRLLGMVGGVLQLPRHGLGNLENAQIGSTGHAYLVDQQGEPLLRAQGPHVEEDRRDQAGLTGRMDGAEGVLPFIAADGRQVLAAWATVPASGWKVVVRQFAGQADEPARRMQRAMSLIIALATGLAVLGALLAARWLVRPLDSLTQQVRAVEAGGAEAELEVDGDAVGRLGRALAAMTLRLGRQRRQRDGAHRRALEAERGLAESARLASLGELAAGLAHELNNPLTVIQGAAQVLPKAPGVETAHWAAEILRETARCRRLVGDLLDLAKPTAIVAQPLSLQALSREAWQHSRMGRRSRLGLRVPAKDLTVLADPQRLKQVLVNLFINALDARPQRGPLELRWSLRGSQVRLELLDHGPGLPEDPEAAFRPFFTTKPHGTGLGLSIARALMRAHGGRLWAEHAPGGGAHFIAEWPGAVAGRVGRRKA